MCIYWKNMKDNFFQTTKPDNSKFNTNDKDKCLTICTKSQMLYQVLSVLT